MSSERLSAARREGDSSKVVVEGFEAIRTQGEALTPFWGHVPDFGLLLVCLEDDMFPSERSLDLLVDGVSLSIEESSSATSQLRSIRAFLDELQRRALPLVYPRRQRDPEALRRELPNLISSISSLFRKASFYAESPAVRERQLSLVAETILLMDFDIPMLIGELKNSKLPGSTEAVLELLSGELASRSFPELQEEYDLEHELEWLVELLAATSRAIAQRANDAVQRILEFSLGGPNDAL